MKALIKKTGLVLINGLFLMGNAIADDLKPGSAAPGFELKDQNYKTHKLQDYTGQWLVLYFYPKDDTPGCTTEACQFRDDIFKIKALNAGVIGVSLDDSKSHKEFAEKYSLPFPLLADTEAKVTSDYGALLNLGVIKFAKRQTFIIDPEGMIRKIYRKVDPDKHSLEVINDLKDLIANS